MHINAQILHYKIPSGSQKRRPIHKNYNICFQIVFQFPCLLFQDVVFSRAIRIRIGDVGESSAKRSNLVAACNRFGLIFVGYAKGCYSCYSLSRIIFSIHISFLFVNFIKKNYFILSGIYYPHRKVL